MLIDQFRNDCIAQLGECVALLPKPVNFYLLLDAAFLPGIHRKYPYASDTMQLLFETLPGCTDEVRDVSPLLISIERAPLSLPTRLRARLSQCSGFPMVSAIASTENLEQLGERLSAWSVIENDSQRFNFRYPDTRRLPGLFRILHPDQRASLCGPMSFWSYIGRDGEWGTLEMPVHQRDIAVSPVLDNSQFEMMIDDSATDEMLFRLAYSGCNIDRTHSVMYVTVRSALATACEFGLSEDLHQRWCEHILSHGSDLNTVAGVLQWQASLRLAEDAVYCLVETRNPYET